MVKQPGFSQIHSIKAIFVQLCPSLKLNQNSWSGPQRNTEFAFKHQTTTSDHPSITQTFGHYQVSWDLNNLVEEYKVRGHKASVAVIWCITAKINLSDRFSGDYLFGFEVFLV